MKPSVPLFLAVCLLLPAWIGPLHADEDAETPARLAARFAKVAQLGVGVQEISGLTSLPSGEPSLRVFLAVSDEGRRKLDAPIVEGALYRVAFRVDEGSVEVAGITPVALDLGDHVPFLDPVYAKLGGWMPDLESCVPLPGTDGLFVIGGERGSEDAYDGGANRLYVIRYPAGAPDRAELLAYLRVPDLDDDTINDRFEAVAALPADAPGTWYLFAFKERTAVEGRIPGYFPFVLQRTAQGFDISAPRLRGRRRLPTIRPDRERLGAQADACVAADGTVWVLDRWRREIHVAHVQDGLLEAEEALDYFDLVEEVPGESETTEPAAPGGAHPGYGRHEAMCFDEAGWLWLAADLGGGEARSVVTALEPRPPAADDGDR